MFDIRKTGGRCRIHVSLCAANLSTNHMFFIEILPAAFDGRLGRRAEIEMLKSFANKLAGEATIIEIIE